MWKTMSILFMTFGLFYFNPAPAYNDFFVSEEEEVPSYAKWGRMAMEETKKRYPDERIVDYLYIGRDAAEKRTTEKFKLWLRGEKKEFGLYISIEYDSETEENIIWTFTETDR